MVFMRNADAIHKALQIAGSQTALARLAGVSQPAVYRWIKGIGHPSLLAALNIEAATLGQIRHQDLCAHIFNPNGDNE